MKEGKGVKARKVETLFTNVLFIYFRRRLKNFLCCARYVSLPSVSLSLFLARACALLSAPELFAATEWRTFYVTETRVWRIESGQMEPGAFIPAIRASRHTTHPSQLSLYLADSSLSSFALY